MSRIAESTLAIHKGPAVKKEPYGDGTKHPPSELAAVAARFTGERRLPLAMGRSIMELRQRFRDLFAVGHAVPTSSGTAAIHAGLVALGVKPGDEVITTPITDHGTVIGIMQLDAIPVFADVKPETLMIDAESIAPLITERTSVILPVHFHGCPAEMDGIMALAEAHGLKVLEDCAQSWLAQWKGRPVGTIGHAGAFSMNESKHMSVGEGGLLITNDEQVARRADRFVDKAYDRHSSGPNNPDSPAVNYRLSEIAAAMAVDQVQRVQATTQRRHAIGEAIATAVEKLAGLTMQRSPGEGESTYWHGLIFVDAEQAGCDAHQLIAALQAEGIDASQPSTHSLMRWPMFQSLNENPSAYATYRPPGMTKGRYTLESCPVANSLTGKVARIRVDEFMTDTDVQQTIEAIRKVSKWYARTGACDPV